MKKRPVHASAANPAGAKKTKPLSKANVVDAAPKAAGEEASNKSVSGVVDRPVVAPPSHVSMVAGPAREPDSAAMKEEPGGKATPMTAMENRLTEMGAHIATLTEAVRSCHKIQKWMLMAFLTFIQENMKVSTDDLLNTVVSDTELLDRIAAKLKETDADATHVEGCP
jgi:hypothetical protein